MKRFSIAGTYEGRVVGCDVVDSVTSWISVCVLVETGPEVGEISTFFALRQDALGFPYVLDHGFMRLFGAAGAEKVSGGVVLSGVGGVAFNRAVADRDLSVVFGRRVRVEVCDVKLRRGNTVTVCSFSEAA